MKDSIEYWKKEADRLFSLYVRQRFAVNDIVKCATCNNEGHWRSMDCGHFRSRKHNSTRCHEHNALAQCASCNRGSGKGGHANGEQYLMGKAIDLRFGAGTALELVELSRQTVKRSWQDWKNIADIYKIELKKNGFKIR